MEGNKQTSNKNYSTQSVEYGYSRQENLTYSFLIDVFGSGFPNFVEKIIIILQDKEKNLNGYKLYQLLKKEEPDLKQSTFYKWLRKLKKKGLVRKKEGRLILDSVFSKKSFEMALKWVKIANLHRQREEMKKILMELI